MASVFLKGLVSPSKGKVDVVYTQNDLTVLSNFHAMPMCFLPYVTGMRNVFLDAGGKYHGDADAAVNAGFLNGADLSDARHGVYYVKRWAALSLPVYGSPRILKLPFQFGDWCAPTGAIPEWFAHGPCMGTASGNRAGLGQNYKKRLVIGYADNQPSKKTLTENKNTANSYPFLYP